jgi:hypothetical protein
MKPNKVETWRSQEKALLERWNAAEERHRAAHAALAAHGGGAPDEALLQQVQASRAEMEALRRQVARLKREFLTGDRY